MGVLSFLGLGKRPAAEGRAARRAARLADAKRNAAKLPAALDSPFFEGLRARWAEEPTIATPLSQLCTASQFEEEDYKRICALLGVRPALRRKQWEFVYLYRALEMSGVVAPGARGLGFGVGRERLPALFAAKGCDVVATDLPAEGTDSHWVGSTQHAASLDALRQPHIADRALFDERVSFRPVNMTAIPDDLTGFDFCWSACALEHLGGLEAGFDFIRASLKTLRPGGVAAHTTEFNLGSDERTLSKGPTVVYREQDILRFADEMRAAGHEISLNLSPGSTPTDRMIDRFREHDIHLRMYVFHKVPATSIGLSIRKAA